jgi:hypothetical protein
VALVPISAFLNEERTRQGRAVAGVECYVYERGTSTELDVYDNEEGAGSPETQPITSNVDGGWDGYWHAPQPVSYHRPGDTTFPTQYREAFGGVAVQSIEAGDLGGTYDLDLSGFVGAWIVTGTLTTDCTLTVLSAPAGTYVVLLVTQDETGDHDLLISDGVDEVTAPVNTDADAVSRISIFSANGDDLTVDFPSAGGSGESASAGWGAPNTVTDSHTLDLNDENGWVEVNSADDQFVLIPTNTDVALAIGSEVKVTRKGAGEVSIAPVADSGVDLYGVGGLIDADGENNAISDQYAHALLTKRAPDEWYLEGALAAGVLPFSPSSLSPLMWVDASQIEGSHGDSLSAGVENHGSGSDLTSSGTYHPTLKISGGKQYVNFVAPGTGAHAHLEFTHALAWPLQIFIVCRQTDDTGGQYVLDGVTAASIALQDSPAADNQTIYKAGGQSAHSVAIPEDQLAIVTATVLGAANAGSWSRVNDADQVTASITNAANPGGGLWIGNRGTTQARQWRGDVAECLVFTAALSAGDEDDLIAYLADKWSVTI